MARTGTSGAGIVLLAMMSAPAPAGAQSGPRFEVAAGVQFGVQDPERPVTPGWVLSGAFEACPGHGQGRRLRAASASGCSNADAMRSMSGRAAPKPRATLRHGMTPAATSEVILHASFPSSP